jgi:hypothetical protein
MSTASAVAAAGAAASPADAALAALVATNPRDIPRAPATPSGTRPVRALAARLAAAGLVSPPTPVDDDVAALHAVFDAALAGGVGCVVLDYVMEVCGDPLMTSRCVCALFSNRPTSGREERRGACLPIGRARERLGYSRLIPPSRSPRNAQTHTLTHTHTRARTNTATLWKHTWLMAHAW